MSEQLLIFDKEDLPFDWETEWQGMPEFKMGNTEPYQKITISFASPEDVTQFASIIGQKISTRTDSLWYPRPDQYIAPKHYLYVDES